MQHCTVDANRVESAPLARALIGQYDTAGQLAGLLIAENADHLSWTRA